MPTRFQHLAPAWAAALALGVFAFDTAQAVDVEEYHSPYDDPDTFCEGYPDAPEPFKERYRKRWLEWCTVETPRGERVPIPDRIRLQRSELEARIAFSGPIVTDAGSAQPLQVWVAGRAAEGVSSVEVDVLLSEEDLSASGLASERLGSVDPTAGASIASRVQIYFDAIPADRVVTMEIPMEIAESRHYWCALVDPNGRIAEANERDNIACIAFDTRPTLDAETDLTIAGTPGLPGSAPPGSVLAFHVDVDRTGSTPLSYCIAAFGPDGSNRVLSPPQTAASESNSVRMAYRLPAEMPERHPIHFQLYDCREPGLPLPDANRGNNEHVHWVTPEPASVDVRFVFTHLMIYDCDEDGVEFDFWMSLQTEGIEADRRVAPIASLPGNDWKLLYPGDTIELSPRHFFLDLYGVPGDQHVSFFAASSDGPRSLGVISMKLTPQMLFEERGELYLRDSGGDGPTCDWGLRGHWTARRTP